MKYGFVCSKTFLYGLIIFDIIIFGLLIYYFLNYPVTPSLIIFIILGIIGATIGFIRSRKKRK